MLNDKEKELSQLLQHLVDALDLTKSEREKAEERYEYVSEWLEDRESGFWKYRPTIYPHGSFRLGTVVRPYGDQAEFDLDFVCALANGQTLSQEQLRELVGDRLKANGNWKNMVEPKTRCWRLDYAEEFHMDIMPAVPLITAEGEIIRISDRDFQCWVPSNPRGFAEWFDKQMIPIRKQIRMEMMKAAAEDLPDANSLKTPLQRAIQIMKRHRDVYFKNDHDDRPASIILTTLAAKAYRQQEDLLTTLLEVAAGMPHEVEYDGDGHPIVTNPALISENLALKWKEYPQRLNKFGKWLEVLQADLKSFAESGDKFALESLMGKKFGDRMIKEAFSKRAEAVKRLQDKGRVDVAGGAAVIGAASGMPKTDYFGGHHDILS